MSTLEPAVVGDVVDLHLGSTTAFGIVRYIGPISGGSWPWAGIELVGPHTHLGQNSGNINGYAHLSFVPPLGLTI
jgi:dynactin complex subunit